LYNIDFLVMVCKSCYRKLLNIKFWEVSQCSGHLRCGGQRGMSFVANFLGNTAEKEFWKSANICWNYERIYSGTIFLLTHVCII